MKLPTTLTSPAILVAAAGIATAATIRIDVGRDGLTFTPNTVTASAGDVVEYHFFAPTHSVVMGDFDSPCTPAKTGGFFSGGITTTSGSGQNANVFQVTINSTSSSIFFYCAFPGHCEAGMSGVINASAGQTLAMYQSKAAGVAKTVAPPAPFGGRIVAASDASSSSSSTTTTTSSPGAGATGSGSGGGIYGGKSGNGAAALGVSVLGVLGAVVLLV